MRGIMNSEDNNKLYTKKSQIRGFVASLIRNGDLINDPDMLGLESEDDFIQSEYQYDYYNEMAIMYLDYRMNTEPESLYSTSELLAFMAGRYSALKK